MIQTSASFGWGQKTKRHRDRRISEKMRGSEVLEEPLRHVFLKRGRPASNRAGPGCEGEWLPEKAALMDAGACPGSGQKWYEWGKNLGQRRE